MSSNEYVRIINYANLLITKNKNNIVSLLYNSLKITTQYLKYISNLLKILQYF